MACDDSSIQRFLANEDRVNTFVNDPLSTGFYTTNEVVPRNIETLPSLVDRLNNSFLSYDSMADATTGTIPISEDYIMIPSYYGDGEGSPAIWWRNGNTGVVNRTPAQLQDALFRDASGAEFELVKNDGINIQALGARGDYVISTQTGTDNSPFILAAVKAAVGVGKEPTDPNTQGLVDIIAPAGVYYVGSRVEYEEDSFAKAHLAIRGAGSYLTTFCVDQFNSSGFLKVGILNSRNAVFSMRDFAVVTNKADAGTALEFYATEGGITRDKRVDIQNVEIGVVEPDGQWFNAGIKLNGLYRPFMQNVFVSGPFGPLASADKFQDYSTLYEMEVGISAIDCYDPYIVNCHCWSAQKGFDFSNTIDPGSEGGVMERCGTNNVLRGIVRKTIGREPQWTVKYTHVNYRDVGIDLQNCKDVHVVDCLIYNENSSELGTGGTPNDIRLYGCQDVTVMGCRHQFEGDPRRILVRIDETASADVTAGAQLHQPRNIFYNRNDVSTTSFHRVISSSKDNDPVSGIYVLKSFLDNDIPWEDLGTGFTSVVTMPTASKAPPQVVNGYTPDGNLITRNRYTNVVGAGTASNYPGHAYEGNLNFGNFAISPDGGGRTYRVGAGLPTNKNRACHKYDPNNKKVVTELNSIERHVATETDYEILTTGGGIILASPDGTRYRLAVNNAGSLVILAL